MSAHPSKGIRFVPKMPPLLGHAPSSRLRAKPPHLASSLTGLSFGKATALWVKRCFAHDEIFLKNLPNNGASVSRAVKRN